MDYVLLEKEDFSESIVVAKDRLDEFLKKKFFPSPYKIESDGQIMVCGNNEYWMREVDFYK